MQAELTSDVSNQEVSSLNNPETVTEKASKLIEIPMSPRLKKTIEKVKQLGSSDMVCICCVT